MCRWVKIFTFKNLEHILGLFLSSIFEDGFFYYYAKESVSAFESISYSAFSLVFLLILIMSGHIQYGFSGT